MNLESDDFEALRKLLALKRYEQPPPGYFNRLPGTILARIEAGETEPSFWENLFSNFVLRPSHAYALGLSFCGMLIAAVLYSLQAHPSQMAAQPMPMAAWEYSAPSTTLANEDSTPRIHVAGFVPGSTNVGPMPSLFNNFAPRAMSVSYTTGQ